MNEQGGNSTGRLETGRAFLRRVAGRVRSQDRFQSTPDEDSLLHPRYGWHDVDRGFSWRKLRLFYSSDARRPRHWWLLVLLGLLAFQYGLWVFFINERSLASFALVAGSLFVAYRCVRPFVRSVTRCWRTTTILNDPPTQWTSSNTATARHLSSPTKVLDDRLVVGASIVSIDRSINPSRVYTKGRSDAYHALGSHHWIIATDERVLVHHLGPLLHVAQRKHIPIEHVLATHEIHELSHWALDADNEEVPHDHAPQWNRRLSAEIRYVSGDGSAAWDDIRHERPPERTSVPKERINQL